MKIILVGYMASGKSTIGKLLSESLHVPFYDLDNLIENNLNMMINEILVLKIPIPAPATTSVNQCLSLYTLKTPVPVAITYPEIPYQMETSLYSCQRNSAPAKAVAVCPEGKELKAEPSGLSTFAIDFKLSTEADIII